MKKERDIGEKNQEYLSIYLFHVFYSFKMTNKRGKITRKSEISKIISEIIRI